MSRMKLMGLALVAIFAFSAIAATAASAAEGPFYKVNGKTLKAGETRLLLVTAKEKFFLGGNTGPKVNCTSLTLPNAAHMSISGVAAGNGGKSDEVLKFTGCTLVANSNGTECEKVAEPIETAQVLNTLGYAGPGKTGAILVLFEPEGANGGNSTVFVTLKFEGKCTLASAGVRGAVIGEAFEGGSTVKVENNKEALHGDVRFLENAAPKTILLESGGAVTPRTTEIEFAGVKAKFAGTALILVDEGGVPVPWGVFN
jgi:hypothetical protein